MTSTPDGVRNAAHHLHPLTVADGQIVAGPVFCGGRWPAARPAEMEDTGA